MNITSAFITGLIGKSQNIPNEVNLQARKALLDYLGALAGGRRFIGDTHPELLPASPNDAFLNGFAAHVLELDDGHRKGMIHLGASVISAVLYVADQESLTSEDVLRGIVMGYEAAVRCACAIQPGHKMRGYHVSGTCGTVGSAMGIAFARRFSQKQIGSTLSCAVSSAAGVLEIQEQASELKPFNLGRATLAGVVAAQIGQLGITGPDDVLGGKRGFLSAFTDTPKPELLTDFESEGYGIEGIYQKVHAACRHCHPAIDAILGLRNSLSLKPEQVDMIDVHTYKLAVGSHDHTRVLGISSAKLSTPYSVALAIVKGSAGYADYNSANLEDANILSLTCKVSVIEDKDLTAKSPGIRGARVIIHTNNGQVLDASCMYPKGEPENPLTEQELEDKFRGLAQYGGLTSEECDEVISEVWKEDFDLHKILNIVCK